MTRTVQMGLVGVLRSISKWSRRRRAASLVLAVALVGVSAGSVVAAALGAPYWHSLVTPNPGRGGNSLSAVAGTTKRDVWAVGHSAGSGVFSPLAAHWNGNSWQVFAVPNAGNNDAHLYGVAAISTGDVWAVGSVLSSTLATSQTVADHWDGTAWSTIATPNLSTISNALYGIAAVTTSDVWGVGSEEDNSTGQPTVLVEHWNGTLWSVVPTPTVTVGGSWLHAVAVVNSADVWAVGRYQGPPDFIEHPLIEHWNGSTWSLVTAPAPGVAGSSLDGLAANSTSDVWSVGMQDNGVSEQALAMHWNGSAWSVVSTPTMSGDAHLFALASIAPGDVWAVGRSSHGAILKGYRVGKFQQLLMHWDGTSWSQVPADISTEAMLSGVSNTAGVLWAAGQQDLLGLGGGGKTLLDQMTPVVVNDTGFVPIASPVSLGNVAGWSVSKRNHTSHSISDASGLGLFDSGIRAAGTSFTTPFKAAGTYPIIDNSNGATSTIQVTPLAAPSTGSTTTSFSITWATDTAPSGFAYDIQILRPGSSSFTSWISGSTVTSASFVADAGVGKYQFQARFRAADGHAATGWSPPVSITVA